MKLRFLLALLALAPAKGADVSISSLPAISTVQSATILPVVDVSGTPTTKKSTVAQLIAGLPAATSGADGKMVAADKAKLDAATDANTASAIVRRDSSKNFTANQITAAIVTGLSAPTNASDAANKSYVDAAAAGLVIKSPARVGTTGSNITLAGGAPSTLDGVSLSVNDRLLVKDQTDNKENGIYKVTTLGSGANGTWDRTTDADTGAELVTGSYVFITSGTVNANAAYTMVTTGTITIGTSPIVWNLFSQVTQIQASNILGQIVAAQIQDAAINVAKFAAGLTPVEIVGVLPTSGNFTGRQVFLTTDGKLYRYSGGAFTAAVPTVDLTGTITNTQIADNSISTPKLQALAVVAGNIAANAVTAGKIAANAVTAGTISAGAVNTAELAAGAVNASKIAAGTITANELAANSVTAGKILAGTITADKLTISSLSAISANIGTITSGSLTSSAAVTIGSGTAAVSITSANGLSIGGGRMIFNGDGSNPYMRVFASGGTNRIEINGLSSGLPASVFAIDNSGSTVAAFNSNGVTLTGAGITLQGTGYINANPDAGGIGMNFSIEGSSGSTLGFIVFRDSAGTRYKIPVYAD